MHPKPAQLRVALALITDSSCTLCKLWEMPAPAQEDMHEILPPAFLWLSALECLLQPGMGGICSFSNDSAVLFWQKL